MIWPGVPVFDTKVTKFQTLPRNHPKTNISSKMHDDHFKNVTSRAGLGKF